MDQESAINVYTIRISMVSDKKAHFLRNVTIKIFTF